VQTSARLKALVATCARVDGVPEHFGETRARCIAATRRGRSEVLPGSLPALAAALAAPRRAKNRASRKPSRAEPSQRINPRQKSTAGRARVSPPEAAIATTKPRDGVLPAEAAATAEPGAPCRCSRWRTCRPGRAAAPGRRSAPSSRRTLRERCTRLKRVT
jgi:hypothetical protein